MYITVVKHMRDYVFNYFSGCQMVLNCLFQLTPGEAYIFSCMGAGFFYESILINIQSHFFL